MEPAEFSQHGERPAGRLVMVWSAGQDGRLRCQWGGDPIEGAALLDPAGPTPADFAIAS